MQKVKINNRIIGDGYPTYIIAEMSANHAGDIERAKEIIRAAKDSGADCVKIQTYTPDTLTIDCDNEYVYLSDGNARKLDNLKKKRKKHVQPINYLSEELINKNKSSKIIDEDVKRAIKLFVNR